MGEPAGQASDIAHSHACYPPPDDGYRRARCSTRDQPGTTCWECQGTEGVLRRAYLSSARRRWAARAMCFQEPGGPVILPQMPWPAPRPEIDPCYHGCPGV